MPQYHFTIILSGNGTDEERAWTDACEGFALDPGYFDPEEVELVEE